MVAFGDNTSAQESFHSAAATIVLTLPDSKTKMRRAPLTPPSVTPPSVSTEILVQQLERDRCKSPAQLRASALLAKVAVLPPIPPATAPMPTASCLSSPSLTESSSSSPASSPPGDGDQFFGTFPKELPASPNGGYISFPDFDQFGDYDEDSLKRLQSLRIQ